MLWVAAFVAAVAACERFDSSADVGDEGGIGDAGVIRDDAGGRCERDEHCASAALPKCVDHHCVECISSPEDSCGAGRYCLPTKQCAVGCKANADCEAPRPYCDLTRHQCVACIGDEQCVAPKKCSPSGTCADTCTLGSAGACPNGTSCCDNFCVDLTADPLHCNQCGSKCQGGSPICCAGQCFDALTSVAHCGKCEIACSGVNSMPSCAAGACQWACATGFSHCQVGNTGCETATSSVSQCGGCAVDCRNNVKNANGATCANATKCDYASCKTGFVEGDGDRSNGCEECGTLDKFCCSNQACGTDLYCDGVRCRKCKAQNAGCTGGIAGECCGGKVCQPSRLCQ